MLKITFQTYVDHIRMLKQQTELMRASMAAHYTVVLEILERNIQEPEKAIEELERKWIETHDNLYYMRATHARKALNGLAFL